MDSKQYQAILDEAHMQVIVQGYSAEDYEVGLLRQPGRAPHKRVAPEVWLAMRAIVMGIGVAAARPS